MPTSPPAAFKPDHRRQIQPRPSDRLNLMIIKSKASIQCVSNREGATPSRKYPQNWEMWTGTSGVVVLPKPALTGRCRSNRHFVVGPGCPRARIRRPKEINARRRADSRPAPCVARNPAVPGAPSPDPSSTPAPPAGLPNVPAVAFRTLIPQGPEDPGSPRSPFALHNPTTPWGPDSSRVPLRSPLDP